MLSDLLDVMREHGWSETGPDHDAVAWLKWTLRGNEEAWQSHNEIDEVRADLEDAQASVRDLRDQVRDAERDADRAREMLAVAEHDIKELCAELKGAAQ